MKKLGNLFRFLAEAMFLIVFIWDLVDYIDLFELYFPFWRFMAGFYLFLDLAVAVILLIGKKIPVLAVSGILMFVNFIYFADSFIYGVGEAVEYGDIFYLVCAILDILVIVIWLAMLALSLFSSVLYNKVGKRMVKFIWFVPGAVQIIYLFANMIVSLADSLIYDYFEFGYLFSMFMFGMITAIGLLGMGAWLWMSSAKAKKDDLIAESALNAEVSSDEASTVSFDELITKNEEAAE